LGEEKRMFEPKLKEYRIERTAHAGCLLEDCELQTITLI